MLTSSSTRAPRTMRRARGQSSSRRSGAGASTGTGSDGANGEETNDGDGGDGAGQKQLHQQKQFHLIEATSLIVLVTMVWAASLFAQSKSTCGNSEWACVILSIVVFVSNIIFVVACFCNGLLARQRIDFTFDLAYFQLGPLRVPYPVPFRWNPKIPAPTPYTRRPAPSCPAYMCA